MSVFKEPVLLFGTVAVATSATLVTTVLSFMLEDRINAFEFGYSEVSILIGVFLIFLLGTAFGLAMDFRRRGFNDNGCNRKRDIGIGLAAVIIGSLIINFSIHLLVFLKETWNLLIAVVGNWISLVVLTWIVIFAVVSLSKWRHRKSSS